MKISELITVLQADMARLGDRELLEGVVSGRHTAFRVQDLLNGDHLGFPGKAIMFLQPIVDLPLRSERCNLSPGERDLAPSEADIQSALDYGRTVDQHMRQS